MARGASTFVTARATINADVTNSATWSVSDGSFNAEATDSASVDVVAPAISLVKTVGVDPHACATSDSIQVLPGAQVTYCYEVTNTGDIPLTTHDLVDDQLGALLNDFNFSLEPGASTFITQSATINVDVTNSATWTASAGSFSVEASDGASVNVITPAIELVKTVGTDAHACAATDSLQVLSGAQVTYCYAVTNTGDVTLTTHDLADDQLGDVLSGFAHDLAPGGSFFITATATITQDVTNSAAWTAAGGGFSAEASDSASVDVVAPAISLVKTVGTQANACATSDTIEVTEGSQVVYCYTVSNTGDVTLNVHDLADDMLGSVLSDYSYDLLPGASLSITATASVTVDTTNTASWTAWFGEFSATATDTATVTVKPAGFMLYLPGIFKE